MYVELNHFAVHLKLTQHFKSTILQRETLCPVSQGAGLGDGVKE